MRTFEMVACVCERACTSGKMRVTDLAIGGLLVGTFKWPVRICSVDGQQAQDIEATVDTGASFTTLRSRLLGELGIEATGKRGFLLADGRRVEMAYGEAGATTNGDGVTTTVVFGENEAPPLLGAYALEGLAPAVDPEAQRLVPIHMILYEDRQSFAGHVAS